MSLETVAETGGRAEMKSLSCSLGATRPGIRSEDIRRTDHVGCLEDKVRQCTEEDGEYIIRGVLRLELEGLEEEQRGDL